MPLVSPNQVSRHRRDSTLTRPWCAIIAGLMVLVGAPVAAQSPAQAARREFIEGLLKSLIQSQVDRDAPPANRPPLPQPDQDLVAVRQHLNTFSTHSSQLIQHWNANLASAPATRPMVGDLIKLNATVSNLQNRAAIVRRAEDLKPDFAALDRDWRLLAHRWQQVGSLSPECLRCIARMNEADAALCSLLGVTPQIDFHALVAATLAVNTSLAHLIEDIELEMPRSRIGRALIAETAQAQQYARMLGDAATQRRPYDDVVRAFQAFDRSWQQVAGKIRQVDSRHLERNVRHVDESSRAIRELLWLPEDVDYSRLSYLARALRRDVDGLFDAVTLNTLLELPAATRVLPVASEFYGLCENFTGSVEARAPLGQLQNDYRFLVDAWPELSSCFSPCRTPEVAQSLKGIEESFVALRDAVGLAAAIDWPYVNELAAALVLSSDTVIAEVQRHVFSNARYSQPVRFESARAAADFRGAARRLHEAIVNHQAEVLGQRAQATADAWAELNERCFQRLVAADQAHFQALRSRATQQVVELQALLQL